MDYAEGGPKQAAKNLIIPGTLIEEVAKESRDNFWKWEEEKTKCLRMGQGTNAGFTDEEAAELLGT